VSISIDPSTGVWTWIWDPSCVSVLSASADVLGFFKIHFQAGLVWQSSGTVDLTGPKNIMIGCSGLATGGYVSAATKFSVLFVFLSSRDI
jgi:hypothetical protein